MDNYNFYKTGKMKSIYELQDTAGTVLLFLSCGVFIIFLPFYSVVAKFALLFMFVSYFIKYFSLNGRGFLKFQLSTELNKGLVLFFISAICSVFFSVDLYHSQKILFSRYFLYLFSFFAGLNLLKDRKYNKFFIFLFLISGLIVGLGGVLFYFQHSPSRLYYSWNVNVDIGVFSILYLPFSFAFLLQDEKSAVKNISLLGFCLMSICLLLNYSRGSFISVLVGIFFVFFISKNRKSGYIVFLFTLILLFFAFLLESSRLVDLNTWEYRFSYIKEGAKLFMKSPLLGKGLGAFELQHFVHPAVGRQSLHIENLYVEILAQSGIIGLASFLYIFWLYFRKISAGLKNLPLYEIAIAGSIFASLISGFFGSVILVGISMPFLFWFLMGISVAGFKVKENSI